LRLAVADGLPQAKLSADQQRELAAALVGEALPPELSSPQALSLALLDQVRRELDSAAALRAAASSAGRDFADAAAAQLQQTFLARARLLSVPASAIAAANGPAAALALSLAPLAESETFELGARQQAARYLAESDLQLTAAWQQLLIELVARRAMH